MADLKAVARVVRWAAESMAFNLDQIPEDKLDWKPNPASKTALQVVAEATGVMRMIQPIFAGGNFERQSYEPADSRDEAKKLLAETASAFADSLERAGDDLERPIPGPMGSDMWAAHSVLFGMIDLVHHHGQITYLQTLLGDAENHFQPETLTRYFAPPSGE